MTYRLPATGGHPGPSQGQGSHTAGVIVMARFAGSGRACAVLATLAVLAAGCAPGGGPAAPHGRPRNPGPGREPSATKFVKRADFLPRHTATAPWPDNGTEPGGGSSRPRATPAERPPAPRSCQCRHCRPPVLPQASTSPLFLHNEAPWHPPPARRQPPVRGRHTGGRGVPGTRTAPDRPIEERGLSNVCPRKRPVVRYTRMSTRERHAA